MQVTTKTETRKRPHLKIWKKIKNSDILSQQISELLARRQILKDVSPPCAPYKSYVKSGYLAVKVRVFVSKLLILLILWQIKASHSFTIPVMNVPAVFG